ncbi:MFS transporter [Paraburkholderia pallida]|uniref:DHA2 family efflux MFS transporter permease subunit n=1 Tax=Paraburkholderia pallida TaxID=2547399 RepID=A0A4P7D1E0_9BURK|nr:MFS transporter [Paraburkholderia pallida]QBR01668.1 DHA2 family efflux MFS transporter permease subunit [Paraburkholderia pallida]
MANPDLPDSEPKAAHVVGAQASPCDALVIRTQPTAVDRPCRRRRLALAATILGSSMAFIDGSVVNVALPSIQSELGASVAAMQWVVNAYLLFLGSLVLVGGSMGDKLGRRTVFIAGIALFTLASAACGFAPNAGALIGARAVQGIGAAMLVPSSLAIIGAVFDDETRGRAIGTWAGVGAITSAVGPVAGGWLVDALSWRAIFFLNVPLAAVTIALAIASVPNSHKPDAPEQLDWPGALSAAAGLAALTFGLTEASARGFAHPFVLGAIGAGVLVLAVFVMIEAHSRNPMVPLDVFHSRDFTGANLVTLLLYFGLGGAFFFLPFTLIRAHGYTATEAGGALLPVPVIIGLLSRFTGGLTSRFGSRALLTVGPAVAGIGFALLALPLARGSYWSGFFPALTVLGLGMTITVAPLTTTVMGSVPGERTGVASGINNAVARVASLLAIAVLGIVFVWSHQASLAARLDALHVPQDARQTAPLLEPDEQAGTASGAAHTPRQTAVARAQADAITDALRAVALVSAACAFAAAGLAMATIEPRQRRGII